MPSSQKTRILLFVILCACACVSARKYAWPRQPASIRRAFPGFVTINEFTAGIGMGQTSGPYSSSFYGFTTAFGYQIDRNFIASGGTGISFYDAGILVPVFLDFRYRFNVIRFTPYLFADGGFLLDVSDLKGGTRIFINPGAGIRHPISRAMAITLGGGLLVQATSIRDTFVNIKAGVSYKF